MTESVVHYREGDRPSLPLIEAGRLVRSFERTFGIESKILAEHAALPIALTPDLLNLLRINFLFDKPGLSFLSESKPGLSFLSESDLLLSSLCEEVEDGLYEFVSPDVRNLLLQHLLHDFGLAHFARSRRCC